MTEPMVDDEFGEASLKVVHRLFRSVPYILSKQIEFIVTPQNRRPCSVLVSSDPYFW